MKNSNRKVAIVYDRVNKFGGAERVLIALQEILGRQLFTLVYDKHGAPWAKSFEVRASFFSKIPWLRSRHELLTPVSAIGFESFAFDNYDLVLSVTSSDAKAVITRPGTVHVCYCLTPPRYLWGMEKFYLKKPGFGRFNGLASGIFSRMMEYLKASDLVYGQRPDHYIAISREVQNRIKEVYGRESQVVYPPVDYDFFSKFVASKKDYFLVVGRLVPYKKTALVIKAFNKIGLPLVIVGDGSERESLVKMAEPNIKFVGEVTDTQLRKYYQEAIALVFPQDEDFGIVPLEAQAAGTPVIAFNKGGAKETVVKQKTGIFFERQTSGAIMRAVKKFLGMSFDPDNCKNNAKKFDKDQFLKNFSQALKNKSN